MDHTSTRGLTLGKYAPLHAGHQFVIETALAEVGSLVVVVYDSPSTTPVPLSVRSGWVRTLYPQVKVVEAWNGPEAVGYTPELMEAHERFVIDDLSIRGITHFYSSERYGEHMSKALGAVDRRVDMARARFPVSGSAIRAAPFANRAYLDPVVYRDLVLNVVFVGAPSTGKTTLARRLAAEHDTVWMPEYGREYWQRLQVDRRLTPSQLVDIAETHLEREDALLARANGVMFTDTNAITTLTFARQYHGVADPRLQALANRAARRYDLVFLCDTDIPYDDTWDRSGEAVRAVFQRQVISDLAVRRVPFVRLSGDLETRVARVNSVLATHRRYANLLDTLCSNPGNGGRP